MRTTARKKSQKTVFSDSLPGSLKFSSRLVGRRVILSMRNRSCSQTLNHELWQIHVNYFAHIHSISLQVARTHQNSKKRGKNRNTFAAAAHSPLCLIINTWYRFRKKNSQHWHSVCSLVGCCFSGQTFFLLSLSVCAKTNLFLCLFARDEPWDEARKEKKKVIFFFQFTTHTFFSRSSRLWDIFT